MLTSVFVPLVSAQWISARSPTLNVPTFVARDGGTAQVSPATVIVVVGETAETVPRAALVSVNGWFGTHLVGPSSTAEPGPAPPPSLPFARPPAVEKPADRFASRSTYGTCACPRARPAMLPWS